MPLIRPHNILRVHKNTGCCPGINAANIKLRVSIKAPKRTVETENMEKHENDMYFATINLDNPQLASLSTE